MMKSTQIALVAVLAMFATPAAMARTHAAHSHPTAWHASSTVRAPGYAFGAPGYARPNFGGANWGSECVTDEGQGRFFPCDGE